MRSAKLILSALPLFISAVALAEPNAAAPLPSPFLVPPTPPEVPQNSQALPGEHIPVDAAPAPEADEMPAPARTHSAARISVSKAPPSGKDAQRTRSASASTKPVAIKSATKLRSQRDIVGQIRAISGPGGQALSSVQNPGKNAPPMITRSSLRDIPSTRGNLAAQPSMRDAALSNAAHNAASRDNAMNASDDSGASTNEDASRTFRADSPRDRQPETGSVTRAREGEFLPGQGSLPGAQRAVVPALSSQVAASAAGKSARSAIARSARASKR